MNLFIISDLFALLIRLFEIFKNFIIYWLSSCVMLMFLPQSPEMFICYTEFHTYFIFKMKFFAYLQLKGMCCVFGKKPTCTILKVCVPFAYTVPT